MADNPQTLHVYQGDKELASGTNDQPVHVDLKSGTYPDKTFSGVLTDDTGGKSDPFTFGALTVLNLPAAATLALTGGDGQADYTVTKPDDDGGKNNGHDDITGIQLEYKTASDNWDKSTKIDVDLKSLKGTVTGLTNDTEYTFRTITTNSYGSTTASDDLAQHVTPAKATVAVTGVTLDQSTADLEAGKSVTLKATVTPDNATDPSVTWSSSDTTVATVSGGVVTAKSDAETGKTTDITVTTKDGDKTAKATITIVAAK